MIEKAKFTDSPLGKAFEKQIETIEDQEEEKIKALEDLKSKPKSIDGIFPEGYESVEINNEVDKIKEYEKKVNKNNIIYYSSKESFNFKAFKTVRSFGESIYSGKITINEANREQADLSKYILNFNNKARP